MFITGKKPVTAVFLILMKSNSNSNNLTLTEISTRVAILMIMTNILCYTTLHSSETENEIKFKETGTTKILSL